MEKEKQSICCDQARELDIVDYLDSIGFKPIKIKGCDYWYHSPFRSEKTPSFKVNRKLNRFFDFGEGWGGNIIDFGTRFYNCSVGDFLKSVSNHSFLQKPVPNIYHELEAPSAKIQLLRTHLVSAPSLLRYLYARKIPAQLAMQFCQEVHYQVGRKLYYGIGFKNDKGGYEIRNPYFKGSAAPKAITTIHNDHKTLSVFEGFFDFLSFLVLFGHQPQLNSDFLILNSLSFFEKCSPLMEAFDLVDLYLDNNTAGQACITKALSMNKRYQDKSLGYKNYEDLNDWLLGKPIQSGNSDISQNEPP